MTLFLLPNVLDEAGSVEDAFPASLYAIVQSLDILIAESERGGRQFLRRFKKHVSILCLNEHTSSRELDTFLEPVMEGKKVGLISDAGLPCIADPGSELVARAHKKKLQVIAVPGPSSFILALQLSGLPAQRFAFHGYLPREEESLKRALLHLEQQSRQEQSTQIWMDTPYRSEKMLEVALQTLMPTTKLAIAVALMSPKQTIYVRNIKEWKSWKGTLEKEPAVFLLYTATT